MMRPIAEYMYPVTIKRENTEKIGDWLSLHEIDVFTSPGVSIHMGQEPEYQTFCFTTKSDAFIFKLLFG